MSKHDTHFFNVFSLVLGILIGIAILLFAFAKIVGSSTQAQQVKIDPLQVVAVNERIRPFGQVAVAGQDNSALAIEAPAVAGGGGAGAAPALDSGEAVYQAACTACHAIGVAGAPKLGDAAVWAPRIAKGMDTLNQHAIEGFQGSTGVMPPKGGRMDISDELVREAVEYMVGASR